MKIVTVNSGLHSNVWVVIKKMVAQHIRLHSQTTNVAGVDAHLVDIVGHDNVALVAG